MNHQKLLKITIGSSQILSRIRRDIRKSRCTTGISDNGGKYATGTAGVVDAAGKFFSTIVNAGIKTGGNSNQYNSGGK
jgi:hypothetical protein